MNNNKDLKYTYNLLRDFGIVITPTIKSHIEDDLNSDKVLVSKYVKSLIKEHLDKFE